MYKVKPLFDNLQKTEYFFIERTMEMLYEKTIDLHRLSINNPLSVLVELYNVIENAQQRNIRPAIVKKVAEEAKDLIKESKATGCLKFTSISRDKYINMLQQLSSENKIDKNYKIHIFQVKRITRTVISQNNNYIPRLLNMLQSSFITDTELKQAIDKRPEENILAQHARTCNHYQRIEQLSTYILIELIRKGFSKSTLFLSLRKLLTRSKKGGFHKAFESFKKIANSDLQSYIVWIKLTGIQEQMNRLCLNRPYDVTDELPSLENFKIKPKNEPAVHQFRQRSKHGSTKFVNIELLAHDTISALQQANQQIEEHIDLVSLGSNTMDISIVGTSLIVSKRTNEMKVLENRPMALDGWHDVEFSSHFSLQSIFNDKKIEQSSKDKLKTAIHYLRRGDATKELESKLMCYWIGLESLLAGITDGTRSFDDVKEFVIKTQTDVYYCRKLRVHAYSLAKLGDVIPDQPIQIAYTHNQIKQLLHTSEHTSPLLLYRSWYYYQQLNPEEVRYRKRDLEQHMRTIERTLYRVYRIRNELFHEAKFNRQYASLTANLRQYLSMSIGFIISYFNQTYAFERTSISDYYFLQAAKLDHLKDQDYPVELILSHSVEPHFLAIPTAPQ